MKILHTSDWHIGQTFMSWDRLPEQRKTLSDIARIISEEHPDALLVSGDIFDTSTPSAAAQTMLSEALVEMREAGGRDMLMILTAGNHDSPSRHEAHAPLMTRLGIETIGSLHGGSAGDPEEMADAVTFTIEGKGHILALPFAHTRNLPDNFFPLAIAHARNSHDDALPLVVMAHLSVASADTTGHSNASEMTVGGIDCVGLDTLGSGYDYMALGHIHRHQTMHGGNGTTARYCGTPLAVSFDEAYEHSVSIVEIKHRGAEPQITTATISPTLPLYTIGGRSGVSPAEALIQLQEAIDGDAADNAAPLPHGTYIRLNIAYDPENPVTPDFQQQAEKKCSEAGLRFCKINIVRKATDRKAAEEDIMTVEELREVSPLDLARSYAFSEEKSWTEEMAALLKEIMEETDNL